MKRLRMVLGGVLMCGLLTMIPMGCSDSDSGSSPVPPNIPTNRVYIMSADSGILAPVVESASETNQGWKYTLTLENVTKNALWYTESPEHESGAETVKDYTDSWSRIYGETSPNGVLDGYLEQENLNDGLYLNFAPPLYDSETDRLIFEVTLLGSTMDVVHPDEPLTFESIKITVFDNNPEGETNTWAFGQVAPSAFFETTETDGLYKLHLENVYPELYMMEQAPGSSFQIATGDSLADNWQFYFRSAAPNASLSAYTDAGEMSLILLELDNPSYQNDTFSYDATVLSGEVGTSSLFDATLLIDSPDGKPCSGAVAAKCWADCKENKICCPVGDPYGCAPVDQGCEYMAACKEGDDCAPKACMTGTSPPPPDPDSVVTLSFRNALIDKDPKDLRKVHIALRITNGPITVCEPHVYVKDLGDFCDVSNDNDSLCIFSLKPGETRTIPNPRGICLNTSMGLGAEPQCPNSPPDNLPKGTLEAEITLNGQGDNTVDLSLVNGISGIIRVDLEGDWTAGPDKKVMTTFTNGRKGDNFGVYGVFPWYCSDCIRMTPNVGQCGDPYNPDQPCQANRICNVRSSGGMKGSATYNVLEYDLDSGK